MKINTEKLKQLLNNNVSSNNIEIDLISDIVKEFLETDGKQMNGSKMDFLKDYGLIVE